jgi:hypothetical protein
MTDGRLYDSTEWIEETGASTGDARENDPRDPGFTDEHDRVFRSHFQHANRLADRGYEQVRPAYRYGAEAAIRADRRSFEEIEKDLENGWLNVRVGGGDWASVREFVRAGFDREQRPGQGRVSDMTAIGTTPSHNRPSFADPLAENRDPTEPGGPEEGAEP